MKFKNITLFTIIIFIIIGCANTKKNSVETKSQKMNENKIPDTELFKNENPYYSRTDTNVLNVPDSEWKKILPDSIFAVARNKETEEAFTGKYWNTEGIGTYYCAVCGNRLFRSDEKFGSTCGWPSFFETAGTNSVNYSPDNSFGMQRTEVLCGRCGSHLGHLFDDGPPPTGKRYCMNSIVLDFETDEKINNSK